MEDTGEEISFDIYSAEVKATQLTSSNISNMGIYATLESSGVDFNSSNALENFMNNIPVTKNNGAWSATPKHYWPVMPGKKLSFFAYAPYNSDNPEIEVPSAKDWTNGKTLEIKFTPKADPFNQIDLCMAKAVLDRASGEDNPAPVQLYFKHTLCWVSFAANYTGSVPDGCKLIIDEVTVNNVVKENTLIYDSSQEGDYFKWADIQANSPKDGSYTLSITGQTLGNVPVPAKNGDNYQGIASSSGFLFLIPQEINPDGASRKTTIGVTFSFVKIADNSVIAQFSTSLDLPQSTWGVAQRIKYNFTLDVTYASLVGISAEMEDWKEAGNTHHDTEIK